MISSTIYTTNRAAWYVLYTFPRSEKLVYTELVKRDYEVFLPLVRTLKIWKNRQKKWIDVALFPGYLFIHTVVSELYNITSMPKVVRYIQFAGKPSAISVTEIDCIRKMIGLDEELLVTTQFYEGEKVRIISGPLAGYEGNLINYQGGTRFGIQLTGINHAILITINTKCCKSIG